MLNRQKPEFKGMSSKWMSRVNEIKLLSRSLTQMRRSDIKLDKDLTSREGVHDITDSEHVLHISLIIYLWK